MKVAIVYDSRTGTTQEAASAMARELRRWDHDCELFAVQSADPNRVAEADLVCIGSWTTGLFVVMQRATDATAEFMRRLPDLGGKPAIVFCTYKLATGSMLQDMAASLRERQALVIGQFKYRSAAPTADFSAFAQTLQSFSGTV